MVRLFEFICRLIIMFEFLMQLYRRFKGKCIGVPMHLQILHLVQMTCSSCRAVGGLLIFAQVRLFEFICRLIFMFEFLMQLIQAVYGEMHRGASASTDTAPCSDDRFFL